MVPIRCNACQPRLFGWPMLRQSLLDGLVPERNHHSEGSGLSTKMPHDFHSPRWETPKTPGALRRCYGSWDLKVMLLLILNLLSGNSATFGELGYSGLISDRLWHHRHDQRLWWKHRRHRYLVAQWLSSVSVIIWFVVCVFLCLVASFALLLLIITQVPLRLYTYCCSSSLYLSK